MNPVTSNQYPVSSNRRTPVTGSPAVALAKAGHRSLVTSAAALSLLLALQGRAQNTEIISLQNGSATFDNVQTGLEYHVEWATSVGGTNQFTPHFLSQEYIRPTGTAAMTVSAPNFFRIVGTNKLSNGIYRISDLPTVVTSGTAKVDVEWSESPNGPWYTNWATPQEQSAPGDVIVVQTPRFFRVSLVTCSSNFAGCGSWSDQTDPSSNRVVSFPVSGLNYDPKCLKVKVGHSVTFSGTFASHPLVVDCQEHAAMTNQSSGASAQFLFIKPGYYNYHCQFHGTSGGSGMAGNIWVVP